MLVMFQILDQKYLGFWGTFYLLIAEFFTTWNIGGAKELVVVHLWLFSGDI